MRRAGSLQAPVLTARYLSGPKKEAELVRLREAFTKGGFQVMGEIGLQYEGISPSDPTVDQYFALAEELDIPVGIHMGTGGSGRANITTPKFRGSMGNPLLLEELLAIAPSLTILCKVQFCLQTVFFRS